MMATDPTATGIQLIWMFLARASVPLSSQIEATAAAAMITTKLCR